MNSIRRHDYDHLHSWQHLGVSHALEVGGLLFISGVMALDGNGELVGPDDVCRQTEFIYAAIGRILEAHAIGWQQVVKVTTYFVRDGDFEAIAETRARLYPAQYRPASSTVRVSGLPRPDALIEVDALAALPSTEAN